MPYDDNETGSYIRTFTVPAAFKDHHLRLRFEGVDSSFHVWVNGKEVGYSQGARNPSEFDITSFVDLEGENSLAVQVYQFSDGSYIEDQVSHPSPALAEGWSSKFSPYGHESREAESSLSLYIWSSYSSSSTLRLRKTIAKMG